MSQVDAHALLPIRSLIGAIISFFQADAAALSDMSLESND
jgi:hypothetical protein